MAILKKNYHKLQDEKLMGLIQQGNTVAFNELYNRYSRRLLYYFFRMLGGDEQKAQDFLQDVFLKIVERPQLFRPQKKFTNWIFTVAHNQCKNEYRRRQVRNIVKNSDDLDALSYQSADDYQPAERNIDLCKFRAALLTELQKFEAVQRSAFLLRYQENFSLKQIAEMQECPEGTIKSRLFYTTQKLANKLKEFNPYNTEVKEDEKIR